MRRMKYDDAARIADRIEAQGGYLMCSYEMVVDDVHYELEDQAEILRVMVRRAGERLTPDEKENELATWRHGYEAGKRDVEDKVKGALNSVSAWRAAEERPA